ncbi:MAG: hypothetical protein OXT65_02525 [Alphaproteobacteria bacterium]|nr:hypothetical protein [Alphaproteobacteria bacterium]
MLRVINNDMTAADLKRLGKGKVGYVRVYTKEGKKTFVLHAADGTAVAAQKNAKATRHAAGQKGIAIIAVH